MARINEKSACKAFEEEAKAAKTESDDNSHSHPVSSAKDMIQEAPIMSSFSGPTLHGWNTTKTIKLE